MEENLEPNSQQTPTLTFEAASEHLHLHSTLPPAEALVTLPPADVSRLVDCEAFSAFLPQFWPAAFDAAPPETKLARLEAAAVAVVGRLDGGALSDGVAKKSCEWFIGELQALGAQQLLRVLEAVLGGIGAALALPPSSLRGYHLLPTLLSHCSAVDASDGLTTADGRHLKDGAAVTDYALSKLRAAPWAASSLVPLATMLRDLTLTPPTRTQLVDKLLRKLRLLDATQLPALTYQLLLLADGDNKPEVSTRARAAAAPRRTASYRRTPARRAAPRRTAPPAPTPLRRHRSRRTACYAFAAGAALRARAPRGAGRE
jgi:hypothetical protein